MPSRLVTSVQGREVGAIAGELAAAVRFHSPVADYEGRPDVSHLLGLIAGVLGELRITREVQAGAHWTTFFDTDFDGRTLQGILDERRDAAGKVIEATLMLRPLGTLRHAVAAMGESLAASPLPGSVR
ncbi:hypothetical protein [Nocardioides sp. T2.26MG-1]|uniref:hypothetical protein n=1 Tax=Nocardioides sp. T2.26MG-1 TaxID=3041166 RepID=UPI0024773790|nr:hypothetical protein [Nocardioides sp. T2.26MG-1]CAI9412700.1 hypothetical protein HIDPHFAB_01838 [Nocardioides sp. T2.26MG-1]